MWRDVEAAAGGRNVHHARWWGGDRDWSGSVEFFNVFLECLLPGEGFRADLADDGVGDDTSPLLDVELY